jgi:hypothetical protein
LVAFDLLYLNGYDLRKLPLIQRKSLLQKLIGGTDIQFSESFEIDGQEMYKHAMRPAAWNDANILRVIGYIAFALFVSGAPAQTEPLATARLAPDEFRWEPTPIGGQRVTLVGDEKKPGMYIVRVRFPANIKVCANTRKAVSESERTSSALNSIIFSTPRSLPKPTFEIGEVVRSRNLVTAALLRITDLKRTSGHGSFVPSPDSRHR